MLKTRAQFLTVLTAVIVLGAAAIVTTLWLTRPREIPLSGMPSFDGQPALGNPDAPVTLILLENFMCEHCKTFESDVFPAVKRDFIDTGQVQARYVNLAWGEEAATLSGLAGECAYKQNNDAFWTYKTRLFESQGQWQTVADLTQVAQGITGLNVEALGTCISEQQTREDVASDLALANTLGVSGTPSVIIGDQGFEAPDYETLRIALEAQLAN